MKKEDMNKKTVTTERAPQAIGPYSQAVVAGGWVFCSGQIALDPATGEIVRGGIEAETRQVLENLSAVLQAAGASLDGVVKTTVYLEEMGQFGAMNTVYEEFFGERRPARATVEVSGLPKGGAVEIDAVALVGPGSSQT